MPNADLYDVAAAVRVQRAEPGTMQIRQPLLATRVFVPGSEAVLSPDGEYVLTRLDLALPEVVRIYDANGDPVETGLDDDELALAAAFGPDHTITYVVTQRDQSVDGDDLTPALRIQPVRAPDVHAGDRLVHRRHPIRQRPRPACPPEQLTRPSGTAG